MAKLAVISDTHFGFASGTERENDCYEAFEEAIEKAKNADLIILPGDIFDSRVPKPDAWARAMRLLERPHMWEDRNVRLESSIGKDGTISPTSVKGVPIIAIHGTHDRRSRQLLNPVQGLEAGFLVHLHLSCVIFNVRGEKIAIHGMGGVPESYAKDILERWDPKPINDAYNIFVLHQSIEPFIYSPLEPPSLKLEDMPENFDLYICGHVHYPIKTEAHGKPFIIPGSTVTTQTNKAEAKFPKGFYMVDTKNSINFVEIESRKVFYEELEFNGEGPEDARKIIENTVTKFDTQIFKKRPLVRVRLSGSLQKGTGLRELDIESLRQRHQNLLISISDNIKLPSSKLSERRKESIEETGMKILKEECGKRAFPLSAEDVFRALLDEDPEGSVKVLFKERPRPA